MRTAAFLECLINAKACRLRRKLIEIALKTEDQQNSKQHRCFLLQGNLLVLKHCCFLLQGNLLVLKHNKTANNTAASFCSGTC